MQAGRQHAQLGRDRQIFLGFALHTGGLDHAEGGEDRDHNQSECTQSQHEFERHGRRLPQTRPASVYAAPVLQRMPYLYALILLVELVALIVVYAMWMPPASSTIGMLLGWGAILSMIVMLVYSIARRVKALREVARLSYWLHFHIFLGFQGFLMAVFHSLPIVQRGFVGLLNPGLWSFLAATVVFCSGIFGRYLFGRLPTREDGEPDKTQKVFAMWIILHRPLALAMYVLAAMHITLSYMFSANLTS